MQVGAENKNQVRAAIALGAVAALLIAYQFLGSSSTPVASSTATPSHISKPAPKRTTRSGKRTVPTETRLDPTLDLSTLAATEQRTYSGKGRNIFTTTADIPAPIKSVRMDPPVVQQGPPPPPPPPPITLKFFGFASKPGEAKRIFLSQGEDVFIAGEGDIVNRRYKILHIGPNSVDIEDVMYNNRQSIPLTQG